MTLYNEEKNNRESLQKITEHQKETIAKALAYIEELKFKIVELEDKEVHLLDPNDEYYSSEADTIFQLQSYIKKEHPESNETPKEMAENFIKNDNNFSNEAKERICITVNPDKFKTGGKRKRKR